MPEASYNGWEASAAPKRLDIAPLVVDGASFPPGVRAGAVHAVFTLLVRRLIREVEPAGEGCWGYAYRKNRNADNLSCHASGTAIDFNASKHPNGKRGTFTAAQVAAIDRILHDMPVIGWGGHFHGTPDEMHFEINATPAEVAAFANSVVKIAPVAKRNPYSRHDSLVKWTQWALGVKVDGNPGPATWLALRQFQARRGIREVHYPAPLTVAALAAVTH